MTYSSKCWRAKCIGVWSGIPTLFPRTKLSKQLNVVNSILEIEIEDDNI